MDSHQHQFHSYQSPTIEAILRPEFNDKIVAESRRIYCLSGLEENDVSLDFDRKWRERLEETRTQDVKKYLKDILKASGHDYSTTARNGGFGGKGSIGNVLKTGKIGKGRLARLTQSYCKFATYPCELSRCNRATMLMMVEIRQKAGDEIDCFERLSYMSFEWMFRLNDSKRFWRILNRDARIDRPESLRELLDLINIQIHKLDVREFPLFEAVPHQAEFAAQQKLEDVLLEWFPAYLVCKDELECPPNEG